MDNNEKILALQLILEDIRGNWGHGLPYRISTAQEIARELTQSDERFFEMIGSIREYCKSSEEYGNWDGRWFRKPFPNGYENMDGLHNLSHTYHDKSDEFKDVVDCLTYPEYRFEDWEDD